MLMHSEGYKSSTVRLLASCQSAGFAVALPSAAVSRVHSESSYQVINTVHILRSLAWGPPSPTNGNKFYMPKPLSLIVGLFLLSLPLSLPSTVHFKQETVGLPLMISDI